MASEGEVFVSSDLLRNDERERKLRALVLGGSEEALDLLLDLVRYDECRRMLNLTSDRMGAIVNKAIPR